MRTALAAALAALAAALAAPSGASAGTWAVVGDSIAAGMAAEMAPFAARTGNRVVDYAVVGSGLASSAKVDWEARAKGAAAARPDVVFVEIGTNDPVAMERGPVATYYRRADTVFSALRSSGARIVCLQTLPPVRPDLVRTVPVASYILRNRCQAVGGTWVPLDPPPPSERAADQVHLTRDGYRRLAVAALRALVRAPD